MNWSGFRRKGFRSPTGWGLSYFLGHLIVAAKYLDADVLEEFVAWSEELGVTLPAAPYRPEPAYPPYPKADKART